MDQDKVGFEPIVEGFIGKTIISAKMTKGTIDEDGVVIQAQVISKWSASSKKDIKVTNPQ